MTFCPPKDSFSTFYAYVYILTFAPSRIFIDIAGLQIDDVNGAATKITLWNGVVGARFCLSIEIELRSFFLPYAKIDPMRDIKLAGAGVMLLLFIFLIDSRFALLPLLLFIIMPESSVANAIARDTQVAYGVFVNLINWKEKQVSFPAKITPLLLSLKIWRSAGYFHVRFFYRSDRDIRQGCRLIFRATKSYPLTCKLTGSSNDTNINNQRLEILLPSCSFH